MSSQLKRKFTIRDIKKARGSHMATYRIVSGTMDRFYYDLIYIKYRPRHLKRCPFCYAILKNKGPFKKYSKRFLCDFFSACHDIMNAVLGKSTCKYVHFLG